MKVLVLTGLLSAFAPCSGTTKPGSSQPQPPAQPPTTTTTTSPSGPTTSPTTGSPTTGSSKPKAVCPSLQIKAPDVVNAGQAGRVTVILTEAPGTPTYKWSVSAGSIESGQGTPSILVHTTNLWGASITATVELGNLPAACLTTTASATFVVGG